MVVLFVLASCATNENDYYVQEIIRLEQEVNKVEYERDIYKSKLEHYQKGDYAVMPDSSDQELSLNSIKTYVRFYPN